MQTNTTLIDTSAAQDPGEQFHAHLAKCERCADQPFNLCPRGAHLLRAVEQTSKETAFPVDMDVAVHPTTGEEYLFQPDAEQGLLVTKKAEPDGWFSMFDLNLEDGLRLAVELLSVLAPVSPYGHVLRAIHAMLARDYYKPALVTDSPTPSGVSYHNFGVK